LATFKHQLLLKHIKALTCSCPKHMVQKLSMFYKYCHDVMSFGYVKQYMSINVQYVINVLVNVYMSKTTRFSQVANRQKTNYCQYICHLALLRFLCWNAKHIQPVASHHYQAGSSTSISIS